MRFTGRAASAARPVFLGHRLACYHRNHDVAPLPCLSGRNPRDPRKTDLPLMRHDPRNMLRGRAYGIGGFLPAAACITGTTVATGRNSPRLSFSTGKDRSSGVSLPVAQTLAIAVRCHVRLRDLPRWGGRRLGRVDCGGRSPTGGGLLAMPGNVFAKRFACLFLWRFL